MRFEYMNRHDKNVHVQHKTKTKQDEILLKLLVFYSMYLAPPPQGVGRGEKNPFPSQN